MNKKIKLDKNNVRVHDDANQAAIEKSLKELGAGRSVLIDSENILIAGNGVFEQAKKLKIPVKIIESDGKELIGIKRTDLKTNSDKRKALAIADNKASDLSVFDDDKLAEMLSEMDNFVETSGFSEEELKDLLNSDNLIDDLINNNFQNTIKTDADSFAVTFIFPKTEKEHIEKYIKANSKDPVVKNIINFCKQEVA